MNNEFENSRKRASSSARTRSSNLLRLEFIIIFQPEPPKSVLTREMVLRFCGFAAREFLNSSSAPRALFNKKIKTVDTERRLTQELLQGLLDQSLLTIQPPPALRAGLKNTVLD